MFQLPDGDWIVKCRYCPKRQGPNGMFGISKKRFSSAKHCHDWWREHEATDVHKSFTSESARKGREADRQEIRVLTNLIWPK